MYLLSMMTPPPKKTLEQIHKMFASFFGARWEEKKAALVEVQDCCGLLVVLLHVG